LEALPEGIRAAVIEVQEATQAPLALVAGTAVTALSIACQGHSDVARREDLVGGTGLYILTIADSGERKSACDKIFLREVRAYERAQRRGGEAEEKRYQAEKAAWETKQIGIKERLREKAKRGEDTAEQEEALRALAEQEPELPRIPRLLYADVTPEALMRNLAIRWPSAALVSSEGGLVFGGRGMGKDSSTGMMATLNQLWDGNDITIQVDRKTSESFALCGVRMTLSLAVQSAPLLEFMARSGEIARDSGFLARFLFAVPESTMGTRRIDRQRTDGKATGAGLAAFDRRIREILEVPVTLTDAGGLTCFQLSMTPEAWTIWADYYDETEMALGRGRVLHDVRDVAGKSAENAARLAALFQWFSGGRVIEASTMRGAVRLARWHLLEARRFFEETALSDDLTDAARLREWLVGHCRKHHTLSTPTRIAQRFGPVRVLERLQEALAALTELQCLRVVQEGQRKIIHINPQLMKGSNNECQ
jgi:putative DNA primase/helicase